MKFVRLAVLTLSAPWILSCGGGSEPTTPAVDNTPASIKLAPSTTITVQSGATTTIAATVLNQAGTAVSATVTWTSADPTIATVSGGVATGVKVGVVNITASAGTVNASVPVAVTPGSVTQLAIRTQPGGAAAGVAFTTQPIVELRDAAGNVATSATNQVSVSLASGGGTLTGTTTVTAAAGVATFTDLALAGTVGKRTLAFASGTVTATSDSVTLGPGLLAALAIRTQPTGASSGLALTTQPVIELRDASGNVVTGSTASVTASIASGGGTLSGTKTIAAVAGVATFTDLSIAGIIGARTFGFAAGMLSATSNSVMLAPGAPATLAIRAQPGTSYLTVALTAQPVIEIRDAAGNLVTSATNQVVASIASGGGTLLGTSTVAAANGVATFAGLSVSGTSAVRTLSFSGTGLTAVTSSQFGVFAPHVVGYGAAGEKVRILNTSGSYVPTSSVKDSSGAVLTGIPLTYVARGTSVVGVGTDGTITAKGAGSTWVVGTSSLSSDSVYVNVTPSSTAPILRTNLVNWHTVTDGTVTDTVYLDMRANIAGAASVYLSFQYITTDTVFTSGKCTVTMNGASPTGATAVVQSDGAGYRASLGSSAGVTGSVALATLTVNGCESKTIVWLVVTPLDVTGVDGSSFTAAMLATRFPIAIIP